MESSDSIDKSWDTSSDATKTAQRSDPMASVEPPASIPHGWMVNVAGRDVVEMPHADVIAKWRSGELSGKSLVWREGMESWAVLESVPAFQIVARPSQSVASARPLASPPPAPARSKPAPLRIEPPATDEGNPVAVYERPVATLVFDEAVEDDWKRAPKAREPSTAKRGSGSSRPPAPSLPPLAPRVVRSSPSAVIRSSPIPHDEPPPPPPLPPRRSTAPAPARPTIPGGLEPPSPAAPSSPPPRAGASAAPVGTSSSPLLAAIALAASNPAPAVVEAPAAPVSAAAAPPPPVTASFDEASFSMRFRAGKNVSLRAAAVACGVSALVASLVTGLVVRSGSQKADRPPPAAPPKVAATPPAVAPEPPPPAALAQDAVAPPANDVATAADKVALTDLKVSEKPKTAPPSKARAWKPPPSSDGLSDGPAEKPVASPGRDDPERAVPDPGNDRSAKPANWNADPGF